MCIKNTFIANIGVFVDKKPFSYKKNERRIAITENVSILSTLYLTI